MNKISKYCQKMAFIHRKGDATLRAQSLNKSIKHLVDPKSDDLYSIEDTMKCPLSKFIHFAANDCGYRGTKRNLIANWIHSLLLKAKSSASKKDNPSWKAAMNEDFKEQFWKACLVEIETLEDIDSWEVVDRTEGRNVLHSIWAFKIKRFHYGMIKKFKARLCARSDQQLECIDYFETYVPFVQWTTVHLLLILEVLLKLKSKQDITAEFFMENLKKERMSTLRCPLVLGSKARF